MLTHRNWKKTLLRLKKHRDLFRIDELKDLEDSSWISIKHDVESRLDLAQAMAEIESALGVYTTYYIQGYLLKNEKNISIVKHIHSLGHEVSIHYDVMDANDGDIKRAIRDFSNLVYILEQNGIAVSTVCPHGNPIMVRNGWNSNKDFFRSDQVCKLFPNIIDVVVHKNKIANGDFIYISDAGYNFKIIGDVANNDTHLAEDSPLSSFDDLVKEAIENHRCIISTHPHRWHPYAVQFLIKKFVFSAVKKIAVPLSRIKFIKALMSRFYYVARKF